MRPITARHGQSSAARTAAARRAFARRTGRRATSTSRHKRCEADSCDTVGSEAEDLVRFCSSHKGGGGGVYLARLRCVAPGCEGPRSYGTIAGGVASCGTVHHSSRSRAGRCCARWRGRGTAAAARQICGLWPGLWGVSSFGVSVRPDHGWSSREVLGGDTIKAHRRCHKMSTADCRHGLSITIPHTTYHRSQPHALAQPQITAAPPIRTDRPSASGPFASTPAAS